MCVCVCDVDVMLFMMCVFLLFIDVRVIVDGVEGVFGLFEWECDGDG